ncbi:hypothetical protein PVK06_049046 [Gossypium arboreum]|uniref:Uncharacterized protein n=1 Tax=Gossypium arboreum TaxID=29729 RepID=A0ABR0MHK2_GOSAR|nr:hypothetical protein PVK06_049046 [Gossypium arboreum]
MITHAKRVQSFESFRQEEVSALVKSISSNQGSPVNLSKKIFSLTYRITSRAAFGNKTDKILQGIINEHRASLESEIIGEEAKEDLVTVLLKIQQLGGLEFPLTEKEIKAIIWDIFSGGSETSSTSVDWAMTEMVRNLRLLKKAQNEVRQVCHGKGDVDEARRDPKHWSEAETFYPERFLYSSSDFKGTGLEYIPFGAGRRICPGILFALSNIELPLAKLLYHFDWELPNGVRHEDLDMTEAFSVTVSRKDDLILIPTNHTNESTE